MQSILFKQLDYCGKKIPSMESLSAIVAETPTEEDLKKLLKLSNKWVMDKNMICNPEKFIPNATGWMLNLLALHQQLIEIEKQQFELCELNYVANKQFETIVSWHESIRGNFQGRGSQDLVKQINVTISKLHGKKRQYKKKHPAYLEYSEKITSSHFSMNEELREACNNLNNTISIKHTLLGRDYQLLRLYLQELIVRKELNNLIEGMTQPLSYEFRCPFCYQYSNQQSNKVPKSCDSCKKIYSKSWDSKNRPPNPTRADAGWNVAFGGNRRDCQGCGEKRQVNNQSECFDCFCGQKNINPKNFTGKGF